MWRVEFFKICKRDVTFIREMRVSRMCSAYETYLIIINVIKTMLESPLSRGLPVLCMTNMIISIVIAKNGWEVREPPWSNKSDANPPEGDTNQLERDNP